jgi:hypothetical protein
MMTTMHVVVAMRDDNINCRLIRLRMLLRRVRDKWKSKSPVLSKLENTCVQISDKTPPACQ